MALIPRLNSVERKPFHPALELIDGVYYIGVYLDCEDTENKGRIKRVCCVVTDRKEIIPVEENWLKKKNYFVTRYPSLNSKERWSKESIKEWLFSNKKYSRNEVFNQIRELLKFYIEFQDVDYYDLITLWIIGTYLHPIFNAYPYIYIGGTKRSGKSKTLKFCSLLSFNSIPSGNMTSATIYRLVDDSKCSLFIDETEKLYSKNKVQDFRNLLLSGYKKGSNVYRVEKDRQDQLKVSPFKLYAPKMIANIRGIDDVLADRSITLILQTALGPQGNREIDENDEVWKEIRDKIYPFALYFWEEIKQIYDSYEPSDDKLKTRDLELWKPILSLAKFMSDELHSKMYQLAVRKTLEKQIENLTETADHILLKVLLEIVDKDDYYKVKFIADEVRSQFDEDQKWINTRSIGRALKRLGVIIDKRRVGTGIEIRTSPEKIRDEALRLGFDLEVDEEKRKQMKNKLLCMKPQHQRVLELIGE
ncbi:hypothetical protein DRN69_08695, partial [Candidatus Pacearchaeota archaeon]